MVKNEDPSNKVYKIIIIFSIFVGFYFLLIFNSLRTCTELECLVPGGLSLPLLPPLLVVQLILGKVFYSSDLYSSWFNSPSPLRPIFIDAIFLVGVLYALIFCFIIVRIRGLKVGWRRVILPLLLALLLIGLISSFTLWTPIFKMDLDRRLEYCNKGHGGWPGETYKNCVQDVIHYIARTENLSFCSKNMSVFPFLPSKLVSPACIKELIKKQKTPFCTDFWSKGWVCSSWRSILKDNNAYIESALSEDEGLNICKVTSDNDLTYAGCIIKLAEKEKDETICNNIKDIETTKIAKAKCVYSAKKSSVALDWKSYRNEKHGFEFKYPTDGYAIDEVKRNVASFDTIVSVYSFPSVEFGPNFSVGVKAADSLTSIQQFVKDLYGSYYMNARTVSVNDVNWLKVRTIDDYFGKETSVNYFVRKNNILYHIYYFPIGSPSESDFTKIFSSLRFFSTTNKPNL